jgi:hypothetical protein
MNGRKMNDLNRSESARSGKAFDFGYKLYVHIRKFFFGGILFGFSIAVLLYPYLPIHNHSTWRSYFYYGPLAIGLGFVAVVYLVMIRVCPRERQVDFESFQSLERWRELDARNKVRLFVGAIFAVVSGSVIGWIVGGWASFIF